MPFHKNRRYTVPSNGGSFQPLSSSDALTGRLRTQYGSSQNMEVANSGEDPNDPSTWPARWPVPGSPIGVPRTVILSSFPNWMVWWPDTYFYGRRDVIGVMGTPPYLFGNYYYFEQWNYPSVVVNDNTVYNTKADELKSPWLNTPGYVFNNMKGSGNANLYDRNYNNQTLNDQPDPIPPYTLIGCNDPPSERFSQFVLRRLVNPYYTFHQQLRATFKQVKKILEAQVDPIYVIDADWCPNNLRQLRNAYLTQTREKFNPAHGTGPNIVDVNPCFSDLPECWGPSYPDRPKGVMPFNGYQVPWLVNGDPGFGTNVLHLYCGHANMGYTSVNNIFDYQAWPAGPEGFYIGPLLSSTYFDTPNPFFTGRRMLWRDFGLDYGYVNHGAKGLYDSRYGPIVQSAAGNYNQNKYNYRNLTTKLYTYPNKWGFPWETNNLWQDQNDLCQATAFYFGLTFQEFLDLISNEDNTAQDLSAYFNDVKIAARIIKTPDSASIRTAIDTFYPPIQRRVEAYYNGIEPGTADFWRLSIEQNDLAPDVSFEGDCASFLSADGIIEVILKHFKDNP